MVWNDKRYYSIDYYLKQTFGEKVYRLSLNGGMTCPNRDGTLGSNGCIFCSSAGSGDFAQKYLPIPEQLSFAKQQIRQKRNCQKFIAYFQAYTNTYAPVDYLRSLFSMPSKTLMWLFYPSPPGQTAFLRKFWSFFRN